MFLLCCVTVAKKNCKYERNTTETAKLDVLVENQGSPEGLVVSVASANSACDRTHLVQVLHQQQQLLALLEWRENRKQKHSYVFYLLTQDNAHLYSKKLTSLLIAILSLAYPVCMTRELSTLKSPALDLCQTSLNTPSGGWGGVGCVSKLVKLEKLQIYRALLCT